MRKRLAEEFDTIYILEPLRGNAGRIQNCRTTHNVFGIQVGVSIKAFFHQKKLTTQIRKRKFSMLVLIFWRKETNWHYQMLNGSN